MQEDQPLKFPVVPLLILVIVVLLVLLVFQATRPTSPTQPETPINPDVPPSAETDAEQPVPVALEDGREFLRENAEKQKIKLVEPEEFISPDKIEGVKMAVQKDKIYDSLLKWNIVGKVDDKNWGVRKIVNMVYIAEAGVLQTVEENDGSRVVVVYDFRSVKSFKALYELDSIKLDFLEGTPAAIRTTTGVLAPIFDLFVPGSGLKVRLSGALLAPQVKPVLENLTLQGYKMVFDPNKVDSEIKMFAQVNTLEGKKVRVTHEKGAVAKIVPIACSLTESERNFCMNLGVLANYHLMPDLDKKVGQRWNVKASHFANMLEPTLQGVPSGVLEIALKDKRSGQATLEIAKGTIELDSSDPTSQRLGKCAPKGTLLFDLEQRYVTRGTLTADLTLQRTSRNHLLFETRFRTSPKVTIDYQCVKKSEDDEFSRFPELEKEKFRPIPVDFLSPFFPK